MTRDEIAAAIRSLQTRAEQLPPITTITPAPTPIGITPTGWLCPACGRGNAPFVSLCPCKPWPEMRITC
jgi:hypothetical protein